MSIRLAIANVLGTDRIFFEAARLARTLATKLRLNSEIATSLLYEAAAAMRLNRVPEAAKLLEPRHLGSRLGWCLRVPGERLSDHELLSAVRTVVHGGTVLSSNISRRIVESAQMTENSEELSGLWSR